MLHDAIQLLDAKMEGWKQEGASLQVEQFFDIATLCGSVEATPLNGDLLVFILSENERRTYSGVKYQFRFALAQLCIVVDMLRFPELEKPTVFTEEEIAQEAARLNLPLHLPEDGEDFHARFVYETTGNRMPPRRLNSVYSNLSSRHRLQQMERGIERVDKREFEVIVNYPNTTVAIPLQVKMSNDTRNPPLFFRISRQDRDVKRA